MNNENVNEPRSNTPLLIIGLVFVVALLGGWWFYSSSKANPNASIANGNTNNGPKPKSGATIPANAPPGAQPAHTMGSATASVTIEEFADYQCPQCAMAHPIMNEIKSMYGTRINFIFREFPLDIKAHDKSYDAAVAAEAAGTHIADGNRPKAPSQSVCARISDPRREFNAASRPKKGCWDRALAGVRVNRGGGP